MKEHLAFYKTRGNPRVLCLLAINKKAFIVTKYIKNQIIMYRNVRTLGGHVRFSFLSCHWSLMGDKRYYFVFFCLFDLGFHWQFIVYEFYSFNYPKLANLLACSQLGGLCINAKISIILKLYKYQMKKVFSILFGPP